MKGLHVINVIGAPPETAYFALCNGYFHLIKNIRRYIQIYTIWVKQHAIDLLTFQTSQAPIDGRYHGRRLQFFTNDYALVLFYL